MIRFSVIVLVALGCASPPPDPPEPTEKVAAPASAVEPICEPPNVVCVGDIGLTEVAIKARLDEFDPLMRRQTIASRNGALSLFINEARLVQEAKRRGLDKRPDVAGKIARYEARVLTRALMEELVDSQLTAETLRKHHNRHPDRYRGAPAKTILQARFTKVDGEGIPQALVRGVEKSLETRAKLADMRAQFPEVTFEVIEPGATLEPAVSSRAEFLHRRQTSERFWVGEELRLIHITQLRRGPALSFEAARPQVEADLRPARFVQAYKNMVGHLRKTIPAVRNHALIQAMDIR